MDYGQQGGFVWPRLTPAVKTLLLINGGVFLVNAMLGGHLVSWLGLSWGQVTEGYGLGIVRLITYQFVHSYVSIGHILMNMLVLYFFGTFVEEGIGRDRLLRLYLVSGAVGGIVQLLLGAATGSDPLTVGASGACYGIMVYAACMAPRMRVIFIIFPVELRVLVWVLVGVGVYATFLELRGDAASSTAHGGHLGGALWGYLAFRMPQRALGPQRGWGVGRRLQGWYQQRADQADEARRARVDELLEKVQREGLGSLTPAERRDLDRASRDLRRK